MYKFDHTKGKISESIGISEKELESLNERIHNLTEKLSKDEITKVSQEIEIVIDSDLTRDELAIAMVMVVNGAKEKVAELFSKLKVLQLMMDLEKPSSYKEEKEEEN